MSQCSTIKDKRGSFLTESTEENVCVAPPDNALLPKSIWVTSHTFSHSQETAKPNSLVLQELGFAQYPLGDSNLRPTD
jgi:hypothetical protein